MPYRDKEKRKLYYAKNIEKLRANNKRSRDKNKEKLAAKAREHRKNHPDYHIKKRYGLSQDRYDLMLVSQNKMCAICGKDNNFDGKSGKLNVDHSHKNNSVSGLLCWDCNIGIGKFLDNTDLLMRAVHYLNRFKE